MPLLFNELLWASGVAVMTQCYSLRGLEVVASLNINSALANIFNIVFIALGSAVAIMVGQCLGANEFEKAKTTAFRLIYFSAACSAVLGAIMLCFSGLFPEVYKTTNEVKDLAQSFIIINSIMLPVQAFLHATYFTMRSGGKTVITFLFDSAFSWAVAIPVAYCLTHFTGLNIVLVFTICQGLDIIKTTIGYIMLRKGVWIQNIVEGM